MTDLVGADWTVPIVTGAGAVAVIGGPVGLSAGVVIALAAKRWLPRVRSPAARQAALEQDRLTRQLPLTAELLAACLGSCSSPAQAAAAVAMSVSPPMSDRLAGVAAELSLGAPPEVCWERLGAECPTLAPLARCLVRTSVSGSPPAAPLIGLAQTERAAVGRAAHARVRRAGVLATAPLGVCFLPAFVLIGVVPVVVGLTSLFSKRI
ncbi:type II secretion system F family protein [Kitasatospora sp. NPDC056138]|uniref:type II secretion system F family protein n=1 Tax=Kitasatospora sp. NPDC056138 TaxID=3345724 RepID=UPI0035E2E884